MPNEGSSPEDTVQPLIFIVTSVGDEEEAGSLAEGLVTEKLAACVSISAPVRSVYRWQGRIEVDEEYMLLIKTLRSNYSQVERWLSEHHSYDLPEIVALPVSACEAVYGRWVRENCKEEK